MCLAVPMEVKKVNEMEAEVEIGGIKNKVRLDIIDEQPKIGDYVIVHAGFAIRRLDKTEAIETLRLFEQATGTKLVSE